MTQSKEEKQARKHAYYLKNKEQISKAIRKWELENQDKLKISRQKWLEENKERVLEIKKKYRLKNKELLNKKHNEYRLKNKDVISEKNKIYKKEHPEIARKYSHNRRALKNTTTIENFKDIEIFERDGYVCGICGYGINKEIKDGHHFSASLDHIIPLSKGGTHTRDNVQCSHYLCNAKKGNKILPKIELVYGDTEFKW